jgi:hypothetical protein
MREHWEVCPNFPEFEISDHGRIHDRVKDHLVPMRMNRQHILMVTLRGAEGQHTRSVARLVAETFIEPQNTRFDTVIYLNGDRTDCRAINLLWRSRPFALEYHAMFQKEPLRLSVYIPETRERFSSLREACVKYGLIESRVHVAISNREPVFPCGFIIERIEN